MMNRTLSPALHLCLLTSLAAMVVFAAPSAEATTGALRTDGRGQLQQQALHWLSTLTEREGAEITLSVPDARVQISSCERAWTFDLPFGPGQALRARCSRPSQQVFLMTQAIKPPKTSADANLNLPQPPQSALTTAWVLSQPLSARTPISTQHLVQAEVPAQSVRDDAVTQLDTLQHMELIRPMKAGTPLRKSDLRPIKLVKRGDYIAVSVEPVAGLRIQARLEATEDGVWGQRIRLKNPQSGRITTAQITGPGVAIGF